MANHISPLNSLLRRLPRSYSYADLVNASSAGGAQRAVARGDAVRLFHDRYAAREHAESFAARAHAAVVWAGPGASLGGTSALFNWGIVENPPNRLHLIARPATKRVEPSWVRIVRASYEYPAVPHHEIATAHPAFAVAQAYGVTMGSLRSELVYGALRSRRVTAADIVDALEIMPRVAKRKQLLRTLYAAVSGAESYLEEVSVYSVFNTVEFSRLTRQHALRSSFGLHRFDLYDAQTRTAIELDGARFHGSEKNRARDIHRDDEVATLGVLTIRFTYADIVNRPEWCREIVRKSLAMRERLSSSVMTRDERHARG